MKNLIQLKQERKALAERGRAILDKVEADNKALAAEKKEPRSFTEDEKRQHTEICNQVERLNDEIDLEERQQAFEAQCNRTEPRQAGPTQREPEQQRSDGTISGGDPVQFRNFGEYVECVLLAPGAEALRPFRSRMLPKRLEKRDQSMGIGAEGGFLVPPQFLAEFLMVKPEEAVVRPRARVIPPGEHPDASISMPALTQGSAGVYGGVTVGWEGEGVEGDETDADVHEVELEPKEATAWVDLTEKLLRNASMMSGAIMDLLRGAMTGAEDYAFLRGDGRGKPFGVIESPGRLDVTRNTANKVLTEDVIAMQSVLMPESQQFAVWVASQSTMPKLLILKDEADNNLVIGGDITKGVPWSMLGRPLLWTGRTPTLGTRGDLMLVDFRYYWIKDGFGPVIAASPHVNWKSNKVCVKIVRSVDGASWVREPLTLEDGDTQVSPIVVLK